MLTDKQRSENTKLARPALTCQDVYCYQHGLRCRHHAMVLIYGMPLYSMPTYSMPTTLTSQSSTYFRAERARLSERGVVPEAPANSTDAFVLGRF